MNIFKILFGGANNKHVIDTQTTAEPVKTVTAQTTKPEPKPQSKATAKAQTAKFAELLQIVTPIGKPENALYRKGYETAMPCIDVTPFLIEQLHTGNIAAIWEYLRTYNNETGEPPKGGFDVLAMAESVAIPMIANKYGISLEAAKAEFSKVTDQVKNEAKNQRYKSMLQTDFEALLKLDFENYLKAEPQAIAELKAFYILNGNQPDRKRRGFWIAKDNEAPRLTLMFCVFSFDIANLETLINHRNNFLKQRRKEGKEFGNSDYWNEYKNFKPEQIPTSYQTPPTETDLTEKLKTLGMVERYYFLNDFAQRYSPQYWDGLTSGYKTRHMGIHEPTTRQRLIDLGLFAPCTDIESVQHVYGKSELAELATKAGFELKKSWTAQKIYDHLTTTTEGKAFLQQLVTDKQILKFNRQYSNDINKLLTYTEQIRNAIELLCFI